jgi:type IV pilus assembly protein PilN
MIKINLLPKKRAKRSDKGQQSLLIGLGVVAAAGLAGFLVVHQPMQSTIDKLQASNNRIQQDIDGLKKDVERHKQLQEAIKMATERADAIKRLDDARAVPAHMLHELSRILTTGRDPTMTAEMAQRVQDDPNRELAITWEPKNVWITSFSEKGGQFRLTGGARSDGDMTQLAKRLQASVYFDQVVPEGGQEVEDRVSGITYHRFTLTGRVIY